MIKVGLAVSEDGSWVLVRHGKVYHVAQTRGELLRIITGCLGGKGGLDDDVIEYRNPIPDDAVFLESVGSAAGVAFVIGTSDIGQTVALYQADDDDPADWIQLTAESWAALRDAVDAALEAGRTVDAASEGTP